MVVQPTLSRSVSCRCNPSTLFATSFSYTKGRAVDAGAEHLRSFVSCVTRQLVPLVRATRTSLSVFPEEEETAELFDSFSLALSQYLHLIGSQLISFRMHPLLDAW